MSFRLSPTVLVNVLQPWSELLEPLYKRVAEMAEASDRGETLWIGCGAGRSVLWWAQKFGSTTEGLDPDPDAVESAEERARGRSVAGNVTFQHADPTNLPHEDSVFDTVVVHMLYLRTDSGKDVIREAVRVLRPGGRVVVIAPSWLQTPREVDASLIERMGLTPRVTMEWKGYLKDAGAVELIVEEAAKDVQWFIPSWLALIVRGWRAAGWVGLRSMVSREVRALRRLTRRRVLGLSIIKGARWPHDRPV